MKLKYLKANDFHGFSKITLKNKVTECFKDLWSNYGSLAHQPRVFCPYNSICAFAFYRRGTVDTEYDTTCVNGPLWQEGTILFLWCPLNSEQCISQSPGLYICLDACICFSFASRVTFISLKLN